MSNIALPTTTSEDNSAPESRVEQILAEAAVLFRDKGYAATSMSDLARIVGISKPALYHHFASKEDLFVASVTREPEAAADRMMAVAEDPFLEPDKKLRICLDLAYQNIVSSLAGQMMPTIAEISSRFPDIARCFRDGFIARQQCALSLIIEEGIANGMFKSDHTQFTCEMMFGPPIMLSLTRSMYGNLEDSQHIDIDLMKDRHFEVLIRILR